MAPNWYWLIKLPYGIGTKVRATFVVFTELNSARMFCPSQICLSVPTESSRLTRSPSPLNVKVFRVPLARCTRVIRPRSSQVLVVSPPAGTFTRLGRQYGPHAEFFPGDIDEVRIYTGALTADEVQALAVPGPSGAALVAVGGLCLTRRRR